MCKTKGCKNTNIIAKGLCQFHYDRLRRYGDTYIRPKILKCEDCGVDFDVRATGNLPVVCDPCSVERHRVRQRQDRRRKGLWEMYKLTLQEYQAMHDAVQGKCEICGNPQTGRGAATNQLSVDHNHDTGKIRGLLCTKCNTALGLFNDDISLMSKAITYLEERNG